MKQDDRCARSGFCDMHSDPINGNGMVLWIRCHLDTHLYIRRRNGAPRSQGALLGFCSERGFQSQNSPFCGSFAKSPASWQRNMGTPLRSNCFIRIRVIDIALVLQSQGMGTMLSKPLRW